MTNWLPIVASGASGTVVTLLGVIAGGAVASRGQWRQWNRDKQIDACTAVIQESTRVQLALRQQWKYGRDVDWTAWNQALALMWLVGVPDVIAMAYRMDRTFWLCSSRIRRGWKPDEDAWAAVRDEMESSRLDFINAARRKVVQSKDPLGNVPVARPSLSELNELYGQPSDQLPSQDAESDEAADES